MSAMASAPSYFVASDFVAPVSVPGRRAKRAWIGRGVLRPAPQAYPARRPGLRISGALFNPARPFGKWLAIHDRRRDELADAHAECNAVAGAAGVRDHARPIGQAAGGRGAARA